MKIIDQPKRELWSELCQRPYLENDFIESSVKNILERVKTSGDAALRELTLQFDKVDLKKLQVTQEEIYNAIQQTPDQLNK